MAAKAGRSPVQELVLGAAGGTRTGSTSPRPGLGRKFFAGESSTWGVSDVTGQTGPQGVSKVEAQRGAAPGWAAAEGRQVEARVRIPVLPGLAGRAPTSASLVLNTHRVSSRLGRKWSHTSHKQLEKVELICL